MKLFYKIWVDAIEFEKSRPLNNTKWIGFTMSYMTILLGLNIATIYSFLFLLGLDIAEPVMRTLKFIEIANLRSILWSLIMMFIPALLINYILIISNKKYEFLLLKYQNQKTKKGNLLRIYFLITFFLFIGLGLVNRYIHLN